MPYESDVRTHLQCLCGQNQCTLDMKEFDVLRRSDHNLLDDQCWAQIFAEIQNFQPHVVISTPPCNTFSRARHSNHFGPPPIRSFAHPKGFPWLSRANFDHAQAGNLAVDRTWEIFQFAVDSGAWFLGAHPEDLGATPNGRPASIWQDARFYDLLVEHGVHTFALYQCEFGFPTPKPTRFITNLVDWGDRIFSGPPRFSLDGLYQGPLPKRCPHVNHDVQLLDFCSRTVHFPSHLSHLIAKVIWDCFVAPSASGGRISSGACSAENSSSVSSAVSLCKKRKMSGSFPHVVEEGFPSPSSAQAGIPDKNSQDLHFSQLHSGCVGPPLLASFAGKSGEFVDGLGRCSPGRWHPKSRGQWGSEVLDFTFKLRSLLDDFCKQKTPDMARLTYMLATGKLQESPFQEADMQALRVRWSKLLPVPEHALIVPPYQPFYLHGLSQTMRLLEDVDWEVLDQSSEGNYSEGVPVGHRTSLPRVPQVFRAANKSPSYDESDLQLTMSNYRDGPEAAKILEEQYQEEERAGRMFPLSEAEARRRYPGHELRIAAQGILDKPGGGHRIIHDGTHGVNVNNSISNPNRLENPSWRPSCIPQKKPRSASSLAWLGTLRKLTGDLFTLNQTGGCWHVRRHQIPPLFG